jgi:hypothetical protein
MNDFHTESDLSTGPPSRPKSQPISQSVVGENQSLASAITQAVTESSGLDHEELPPLYATVDVEQLEALLVSVPDDESCTVSFCYDEYLVEVRCSGTITVW